MTSSPKHTGNNQPLRFPLPSFSQTTSLAEIRTLVPLAALLTHLIMSTGSRETQIDGLSLGMHRVCQRRRAQRAGQKYGKGGYMACVQGIWASVSNIHLVRRLASVRAARTPDRWGSS
jgi:hypothetical protein